MDSSSITALASLLSAILTLILKYLFDGWIEARRGKKDEAQRMADKLRETQARKRQWIQALYTTRTAWNHYALKNGLPPPDFPPSPDDERPPE